MFKEKFLVFENGAPAAGSASEFPQEYVPTVAEICEVANGALNNSSEKIADYLLKQVEGKKEWALTDEDIAYLRIVYGKGDFEFYKLEKILDVLNPSDQEKLAEMVVDCEADNYRPFFKGYLEAKPYLSSAKRAELWGKYDMGKWLLLKSGADGFIKPAELLLLEVDADDRELLLDRHRGDADFLKKNYLFIPVAKLADFGATPEVLKDWFASFGEDNANRRMIINTLIDSKLADVPKDSFVTLRPVYSFCIAVENALTSQKLDFTKENIVSAFDRIFKKFEETKNASILDKDTNVIMLTFNGSDGHMAKGEMLAMCKRFGASIDKDLEAGGDKKSALKVKADFLASISNSKGKTTIIFNGHGDADKLIVWRKHKTLKNRGDVVVDSVTVSPQELAQALIKSKNVGNINLLVNACYFHDYQTALNNELIAKGETVTPLIFGAANKGAKSFFSPVAIEQDNDFFTALNKASKDDSNLAVNHFYEAETYVDLGSQDSFMTAPAKDGLPPVEVGQKAPDEEEGLIS